mgnify:FL=1
MKKLLAFALVIGLFSCNNEINTNIKQQKVYFEVHHANYAWIVYNNGIMIDSAGNVKSFDLKSANEWEYPDDRGKISAEAMSNNYKHCTSLLTNIEMDSLKYYVNKISKAAKGTLSKPESIMADAGITEYIAYIFDSKTNLYQKVLLSQWGDNQITNNSKEARELYRWLYRITQDLKQ